MRSHRGEIHVSLMAASVVGFALLVGIAWIGFSAFPSAHEQVPTDDVPDTTEGLETATFGAGCFWCVEAVFHELRGVHTVVSGYSGGAVDHPTYRQVCSGQTGHAEVVQIVFDPKVISYDQLLEVFWRTHDPTTLNRQGADVGTQYRSVVFYHNDQQKQLAEHYKDRLNRSEAFSAPVVTEISPFTQFFPADDGHQNYYQRNQSRGYCQLVIRPKLKKFREAFQDKLK